MAVIDARLPANLPLKLGPMQATKPLTALLSCVCYRPQSGQLKLVVARVLGTFESFIKFDQF